MWTLILQRIALDFLFHIVYFPIWWYTDGAKRALLYCLDLLQTGNDILAPGLWIKNLFVPMFGQYDWQGRLVSFIMRFVNIIGRGIALFFWSIFVLVVFAIWIVWPIFLTYMLFAAF